MPLDSRTISTSIRESLISIPFDNPDDNSYLPYQTKVSIYDEKCSGCGFARIEVVTTQKVLLFNDIISAIDYVSKYSGIIKRSCEYPTDVLTAHGQSIYPSLTDIITNTCRFWDSNKMEVEPEPEIIPYWEINGEERIS